MPYLYNAAGTSLGNSGGVGNRFLFTGREWIKDLRVYDYRHRHYQPELGRFLQPDPIQFAAGDYNLYRYCHNDPVNKNDPTGLDIEWGFNTYSPYEHKLISVTDAAAGGMHYFEFFPTGSGLGSRGAWNDSIVAPPGYSSMQRWTTTPEQDLVVLDALREARKAPEWYSIFGKQDCNHRPWQVVERALGSRPPKLGYDPLDRKTGDIRDARGNKVGWENPNTGNIYDKNWNWAGWNRDWQKTFKK